MLFSKFVFSALAFFAVSHAASTGLTTPSDALAGLTHSSDMALREISGSLDTGLTTAALAKKDEDTLYLITLTYFDLFGYKTSAAIRAASTTPLQAALGAIPALAPEGLSAFYSGAKAIYCYI
ncbi:hypothetical protein C8R44DRAFT_735886 [Mycena epipterygia]|nr:hypothetical protein C8R44DRAFT_735886 [Mycena epipterygia]